MSLGTFPLGSTVRLPLQVLENGGLPVSIAQVDTIEVRKIIKPDLSSDNSYPKSMILIDTDSALYYLDYKPTQEGNYIVIYNITINEIVFSQMDSFYVSSASSGQRTAIPTAIPVWDFC